MCVAILRIFEFGVVDLLHLFNIFVAILDRPYLGPRKATTNCLAGTGNASDYTNVWWGWTGAILGFALLYSIYDRCAAK